MIWSILFSIYWWLSYVSERWLHHQPVIDGTGLLELSKDGPCALLKLGAILIRGPPLCDLNGPVKGGKRGISSGSRLFFFFLDICYYDFESSIYKLLWYVSLCFFRWMLLRCLKFWDVLLSMIQARSSRWFEQDQWSRHHHRRALLFRQDHGRDEKHPVPHMKNIPSSHDMVRFHRGFIMVHPLHPRWGEGITSLQMCQFPPAQSDLGKKNASNEWHIWTNSTFTGTS